MGGTVYVYKIIYYIAAREHSCTGKHGYNNYVTKALFLELLFDNLLVCMNFKLLV